MDKNKDPQLEEMFNEQAVNVLGELQDQIHSTAKDKGWWNPPNESLVNDLSAIEYNLRQRREFHQSNVIGDAIKELSQRNEGELIALMHSELSEALRCGTATRKDDKIPEFDGVSAALADVIIRILDFAGGKGYNVINAMLAKIEMNKGRAFKHGGRKF